MKSCKARWTWCIDGQGPSGSQCLGQAMRMTQTVSFHAGSDAYCAPQKSPAVPVPCAAMTAMSKTPAKTR